MDIQQVERFDVVTKPHGENGRQHVTLADGSRAPDLFVRLNLRSIEDKGTLSRTLKAVVTCSLSTGPWQSVHFVNDETTPPLVNFAWNSTLELESTFTGVHSDHLGEPAKKIAVEFSKGLTNKLLEIAKNYPELPQLPDYLYGPYEPVADFGFLKVVNAKRVSSQYGFYTHNQTFWKFQTASNPVVQLERMMEEMRNDGWKVEETSFTNTVDYYVRGTLGKATLEIFRPRESRSDHATEEN